MSSLQDEVLIAGFGRRGHAVGDIPGVRFKVRPGSGCGVQDMFGLLGRVVADGSMLRLAQHGVPPLFPPALHPTWSM